MLSGLLNGEHAFIWPGTQQAESYYGNGNRVLFPCLSPFLGRPFLIAGLFSASCGSCIGLDTIFATDNRILVWVIFGFIFELGVFRCIGAMKRLLVHEDFI